MTSVANSSERRLRAPAALLSDEADTDPPTGMPCKQARGQVGGALADEVA